MSRKGIFGLFGKKEEEPKVVDVDKAKADKFLKQKVVVKKAKEVKKHVVVKHVVVSGDTLSGIAKKYYDDAGKYKPQMVELQKQIGNATLEQLYILARTETRSGETDTN